MVSTLGCWVVPALSVAYAVTLDDDYNVYRLLCLPVAGILFSMCFFMKPRNKKRWYKVYTIVNFILMAVVTEYSLVLGDYLAEHARDSDAERMKLYGSEFYNSLFFGSLRVLAAWVPLFVVGFWVRASIATLSDIELSIFLRETVFISGFATMGPLLFLTLEGAKCLRQTEIDFSVCKTSSFVVDGISAYLLMFYAFGIIRNSVPLSVRKTKTVSFNQFATMVVGKKDKCYFFLSFVALLCGCYLFSFLGTYSVPDLITDRSIKLTGYIGMISLVCIGIMEALYLLKQRQMMNATSNASEREEKESKPEESEKASDEQKSIESALPFSSSSESIELVPIVEELSWVFVLLPSILVIINSTHIIV